MGEMPGAKRHKIYTRSDAVRYQAVYLESDDGAHTLSRICLAVRLFVIYTLSILDSRNTFFNSRLPRFRLLGSRKMQDVGALTSRR